MDTQIPEIRELILARIATILQSEYQESVQELTEENLTAMLAFKGDPRLNELRLALERIRRGDYGRCVFCKSPIPETILLKNPVAHFCEKCTSALRFRTGITTS